MIRPQSTDGQWRVSHAEEYGADLVDTRNVRFDAGGNITMQPKPVVLYTSNDDAQFQNLLSVCSDENFYYLVTSGRIFKSSLTAPDLFPPTQLPISGAYPNIRLNTDAVIFAGLPTVSGDNSVAAFNGSTWVSVATGLSSSFPHPLCNFEYKAQLAVANGNTVRLYDNTYALIVTLTIPVEYVITTMRSRGNNLYIGTRNVSGGTAMMFVWTGSTTAAQYFYNVDCDWIYSMAVYGNSVAIITSAGQLLQFNGGGFTELDHLPVYDTPYSWSSSNSIANSIGKVANRGMIAIGDMLYLNIDGQITITGNLSFPGNYLPNQPGGIWSYSKPKNLSHVAGYAYTKFATLALTFINSNELVTALPHGCSTGDPVYLSVAGGISGAISGQLYYAIVTGTNSMYLALTPGAASLNSYMTLSAADATGIRICVDVLDSIGSTLIVNPGAIGLFNKNIPNSFFGTEIIYGGSTKDGTDTQVYTLQSLGIGRGLSYIVTSRMFSSVITDTYKQLYAIVDNLLNAVDKLRFKYRLVESTQHPTIANSGSTIAWTSSTVFTAAASQHDYSAVITGDEMTIIRGAGAGYIRTIASCVLTGSNWVVTLTAAVPWITAGQISEVCINNWIELSAIDNTHANLSAGFAEVSMLEAPKAAWIQVKVDFGGINPSMGRLFTSSTPNTQPK